MNRQIAVRRRQSLLHNVRRVVPEGLPQQRVLGDFAVSTAVEFVLIEFDLITTANSQCESLSGHIPNRFARSRLDRAELLPVFGGCVSATSIITGGTPSHDHRPAASRRCGGPRLTRKPCWSRMKLSAACSMTNVASPSRVSSSWFVNNRLVHPAEVVGCIAADGCNDRVDDGSQPAQAYDQLFGVVPVRPADNVGSPHVQKLLASFHKRGVEGEVNWAKSCYARR